VGRRGSIVDVSVSEVLHTLQSLALLNASANSCREVWKWSKSKVHCDACPDIPFYLILFCSMCVCVCVCVWAVVFEANLNFIKWLIFQYCHHPVSLPFCLQQIKSLQIYFSLI
jgi:hypothetical protein